MRPEAVPDDGAALLCDHPPALAGSSVTSDILARGSESWKKNVFGRDQNRVQLSMRVWGVVPRYLILTVTAISPLGYL